MKSEVCYLLLGSNLGNKRENILKALKKIETISKQPIKMSSFYLTEPWGFNADDLFYNLAVEIETEFNPNELLKKILGFENDLGRKRNILNSYESREIDIDIIFYGDKIICEKDLVIPHPKVHLRKFALMPLCELNPSFIHPKIKKSLKELLEESTDSLNVKIIAFKD